ncbi:MAG TPA: hypothetical protein VJP02_18450 [Candidatus Sulfotelmatobacter sp.]|nr:hypothetical protein [Candidatus Sulfotelmatobacter sp.]
MNKLMARIGVMSLAAAITLPGGNSMGTVLLESLICGPRDHVQTG